MIEGWRRSRMTCDERRYPEPDHGYTMAPDEATRLKDLLAQDLTSGNRSPGTGSR